MRIGRHPFSAGVLAVAIVVAACSSGNAESAGGPDRASEAADAIFADRGPFDVGVITLELPDRAVEVWYPADPDGLEGAEPAVFYIRDNVPESFQAFLPADVNPPYESNAFRDVAPSPDGPFPLVLFSHGFGGFPTTSTELTDHWASWGFVVAAPDHVERGLESQLGQDVGSDKTDPEVLREVVDLLTAENEHRGSFLEDVVSTEEIAVTGHSAGGAAAIAFGGEPDVVTYIPLAGAVGGSEHTEPVLEVPDTPSLFIAGTIDTVVDPERTRDAFDRSDGPKRLVTIDGVGHNNAFTDVCEIGDAEGGVVGLAREAGVPIPEELLLLGADGCQPGALDSSEAWPVVNHFVVAQLREAFGLEAPGTGFEDGIEGAFGDVRLTLEQDG